MDIEIRHLRYFVAVAEELHFGRAAQRLNLAQPPLSQQIRQLEDRLGHPLFTRTSRAVKLTAAGEVFLTRARRTLRNLQDDIEEARSIGRGEEGLLRVGFIGSAMLTPLPKVLGAYHRKYPRVQFQIHESFSAAVVRGLVSSALDVGLLRDSDPADGIAVETIASEQYVAVLPRRHPLAAQKSISPAALKGQPFVLHTAAASKLAFEKPMSICEAHGFRPQITQEAPQWFTLLRFVGAGLGVTIAPQCVQHIALHDVVCVKLRGVKIKSDIELAYRKGEDRALVHAFANMVREGFGQRVK